MRAKVMKNHFTNEAEAVATIKKAGFFPAILDIDPVTNTPHWHDFDSMLFVLDGQLMITNDVSGEVCVLEPGDRVDWPARLLHHENHKDFRAVFGFSVDPTTLSIPIDKPPEQLIATSV
ncbi:MAG: hypothetical protein ACI9WC_003547 [Arenicella sp.]|jgi:hypothetical protein